MRFRNLFALFAIVITAACVTSMKSSEPSAASTAEPSGTPAKVKKVSEFTYTDGEFDGTEITKSDEEWKKLLTAAEFNVMRQDGTEAPYTGALTKNKKHGTYYCGACGLAIFRSDAKFESDTGWPSFFQTIFKKNVVEKVDKSLGEERTEVECSRCHSHLGHVFDDGPKPTGLRYCMNSVALKFKETK